jgi:SOS-response transcriptional repressor LexA
VVAILEDEATVKRLRVANGRVELHAENPNYPPIPVTSDDVNIAGKVVAVVHESSKRRK